jgi:hypothetical protein
LWRQKIKAYIGGARAKIDLVVCSAVICRVARTATPNGGAHSAQRRIQKDKGHGKKAKKELHNIQINRCVQPNMNPLAHRKSR